VRRIWSGNGKPGDVDLLDSVAETIGGAAAGKTICFLADSAVMPTRSFVKKFRGDFEKAVAEGGSPVYRKYHGGGRAATAGGVAAGAHHA
jgi:NADH:ubiquinone oxidoreductase subunit F (NADH-binding)